MVFTATKIWKVQILEGEFSFLSIDFLSGEYWFLYPKIFNDGISDIFWKRFCRILQLKPFVKTFCFFSRKISQISLKLFGNSHWKLHWLINNFQHVMVDKIFFFVNNVLNEYICWLAKLFTRYLLSMFFSVLPSSRDRPSSVKTQSLATPTGWRMATWINT